ncbi:MAG: hypothetical protein J4432_05380 [DPANN group archaeon]|nr:hypothetical protein [DPANN group archaeon]
MDRVKTNISGFDDLIDGGIPRGSSVLLSGPCGAGKVYFASEFLYKGAEPSIYYAFEQSQESMKENLSVFNWDMDKAIKGKQFNIIQSELYQFESFLSDLEDNIEKTGAARVVVDSLTVIGEFFDSPYKLRKSLLELKRMVKNNDATAILLSETPANTDKLSTFGSEEFVLDGVILLHLIKSQTELNHAVSVRKMIGTNFASTIHPFEIRNTGLKVHKIRELRGL